MHKIAVVIPCFKCGDRIVSVIQQIPKEVTTIYVVDDDCPDHSGSIVEKNVHDARVQILRHSHNQGVGGALVTGYRQALKDGHTIVIKIDGDGQMDPSLISHFVHPLLQGWADYTKGNRFYRVAMLKDMPFMRLVGNSILSFINKLSTGYWNIMDPTNGFTAIHRQALELIPLEKLDKRFFFESDMLFQLNLIRAVVWDIPLNSTYGKEKSTLKIRHVTFSFFVKHVVRMIKRFFYSYVLRDFNLGTIEAIGGMLFLLGGLVFGGYHWYKSIQIGIIATSGTVMIAGIMIILGIQFILAALMYDVTKTPKTPIQKLFQ